MSFSLLRDSCPRAVDDSLVSKAWSVLPLRLQFSREAHIPRSTHSRTTRFVQADDMDNL